MVKKVLMTTTFKRKKDKIYFCGTDENGFITVGEADMARGRKKKEK